MKTFLFPFSITGTAQVQGEDMNDAIRRYDRLKDNDVSLMFGEPRFTYYDEVKEKPEQPEGLSTLKKEEMVRI